MYSRFKTGLLLGGLIAGLTGCSGQDPVSPGGAAAKLTVSAAPAGGRAEVDRPPPGSRDEPIQALALHQLRFDQVLSVAGLDIRWLAVEDSRCPEGVVCVWEGQVKIGLAVSRGEEDLGQFAIVLHAGDEDEAQVRIGTHTIGLVGIEPYPVVDVETSREDYVAMLVIGRDRVVLGPDGLVVSEEPRPRHGEPDFEDDEPVPGDGGPFDDRKPVPAEIGAALDQSRQQWEALGPSDYRFTFQRICFCLRDYTREVVLEVRDGDIVSAHYADTGAAVVDQGVLESYRTIGEMFEFIDDAIDQRAVQIDVEYDGARGFPVSIYVDFDRRIADEETGFGARNLEVLP